ncbi:hypothetical protein SAMN04488066_11648 [Halorubrum aquaticum]|uniref:Uncharacterized protein n=1 Tax=Halorubrum aquaticum TaxID=387340 RepID=A0A1I3BZ86_9EURY|nr:hypothetical protein SAMN04488066_11648 [Halorubrum aquaticum]
MTRTSDSRPATTHPSLPAWFDRYTTLGLYGLLVGTGLCLVAFVTNPAPDPSFPWATLPASLRLPFEQPRIEHWPVTYTLGIWLWIAGFPALFFGGYRRFGTRTPFGSTTWLAGLPTLAMLSWTTYCRVFWPKLHPPTWNAPSYTFICWLYCSSYDVVWSNTAYLIVLSGIVATLLAVRNQNADGITLLGFGLLALPLGLPAVYEGFRRTKRTTT